MKDIDDTKAPLLDHLIELRGRLLKCVWALLLTGVVCFYFSDKLFAVLVHPLKEAFGDAGGRLVYTKLYEAFFVQVKIAIFGAFFLSFPIIANQLWAFVAPGLYAKEKKALLPFIIMTPVLFVMGASLAYFVVMPTAFHFFLQFQGNSSGLSVEALPSAGDYLTLVMQFILAFGISFLMPVLLMLLNRAGFVTRAQLIGLRRYMIVAAFVLAAVLTPPDVVSQLMLAIPLLLLYEITIVAIWFTDRRRAQEEVTESASV
ncbi:sec-independent protein translocase protein TatC [Sphingobium wenxiniae]|uniref:Sec-independent protein translocase protein TatC n=2 Tax=Sphingobium TaxID=165695 RepID=T0GHW6_9SPHN|nr:MULTISPECIES: twin-arginine translocase subunit TatC [Sphingobium]EQA99627.1 preprotein translocase subunit TatC [Sphingobium baderi LL03]KMS61189.1 preprotein translocase subunit TatC [Sphingobium baderi LL03]MBB6190363.1 sec-independent protein translocase protein TatC [Sphingobium wenxiniae]TWH95082.1 Sec-independent protein translocase TatC [Sphingobium wenxiniae]WRD74996.1 twin-arginine translocase subunit TatC [Sphingobium baderi]